MSLSLHFLSANYMLILEIKDAAHNEKKTLIHPKLWSRWAYSESLLAGGWKTILLQTQSFFHHLFAAASYI